MAKNNMKSIRLSDEVLDYILSADGKSFNEKFENIILEAKKQEPELRKTLLELKRKILKRQQQLDLISEKITSLDITIEAIFSLQDEVHRLQDQIKQICSDDLINK